jgi:hypothetical protein
MTRYGLRAGPGQGPEVPQLRVCISPAPLLDGSRRIGAEWELLLLGTRMSMGRLA